MKKIIAFLLLLSGIVTHSESFEKSQELKLRDLTSPEAFEKGCNTKGSKVTLQIFGEKLNHRACIRRYCNRKQRWCDACKEERVDWVTRGIGRKALFRNGFPVYFKGGSPIPPKKLQKGNYIAIGRVLKCSTYSVTLKLDSIKHYGAPILSF